jgi:hypothetical protein
MFRHLYLLELVQTSFSFAVFLLAVYIFYQMAEDHRAAKELYRQRLIPKAIVVTTWGNLTVEIWRIAMTLLMVVLSTWGATAPPPPNAGHFWDNEQYSVGRILFILFIILKGAGAIAEFRSRRTSMDSTLEFTSISELRPEAKPTRLDRN